MKILEKSCQYNVKIYYLEYKIKKLNFVVCLLFVNFNLKFFYFDLKLYIFFNKSRKGYNIYIQSQEIEMKVYLGQKNIPYIPECIKKNKFFN